MRRLTYRSIGNLFPIQAHVYYASRATAPKQCNFAGRSFGAVAREAYHAVGAVIALTALAFFLIVLPVTAGVTNGAFESGGFDGWTADQNWVISDNTQGWYAGWQGKYWAWSGGKGEPAMGKLSSKPFTLDKDAVRMLISGWSSIHGTGAPRKWNYVTLNLEDGTEIDRVYAPNTTAFVPVFLDGTKYKGKRVYVQAVDDADEATYSMLCIDDVRTMNMPGDYAKAVPPLPAFDAKKSIKLENKIVLVEVSKANGSITRIRDKKGGLELILEPRLAGSYKFALPVPGKEPWETLEANWIFGRDQKLSSYKIEGKKLTLHWDGPLRNYLGAKFNASVTETIQTNDFLTDGVVFGLSIDNTTALPVGEVYFPIIGGIQGLGHTRGQLKTTQLVRPAAGGASVTSDIFRLFNSSSWLGDQGPEQFYSYPDGQPEPWVGFSSPKAGMSAYIVSYDPQDRKKVIRLELVPSGSGTPREDGNWPRPEELKGLPVGVELSFVDLAGCPAHKTYEAGPVAVSFRSGGEAEMRKWYSGWKEAMSRAVRF